MENYIVINGKKAELTEEQLKALGIVTEKKNPFTISYDREDEYFFITSIGGVVSATGHVSRQDRYDNANYCTDRNLLQQRAWHETLERLLWRYSMEHDGDKINWKNDDELKYYIYFNCANNKYAINFYRFIKGSDIYFHTKEIAENAIKEIVEPFMKEHPSFVW